MKNVQEVLPYLNLVAERRDEAQREEYLKSKGIPTDDNLIIEDLGSFAGGGGILR